MHPRDEIRRLLPADRQIAAGELIQLESALTLVRLDKGDRLLDPGEVCAVEGIVTKGCLRVYFTEPDGSERVLYFAPEGWYVTDIESLITGRPTTLGIDALEPTEVWVLDKATRPSLEARFPACDRILRAPRPHWLQFKSAWWAACERRPPSGTSISSDCGYRELEPKLRTTKLK
jgi:hypothetical protein